MLLRTLVVAGLMLVSSPVLAQIQSPDDVVCGERSNILTYSNGQTCMIGYGEAWETTAPVLKGKIS